MGECLVGLGHLVGVLALLHRGACVVGRVHDLAGQALLHGLFTAVAGIAGQPAQAKGLAALGTDLHGHLVGGAAHTAGLGLQGRHDVLNGSGKDLKGLLAGLVLDDVKGTVDDLLGYALLAVQHDAVDELSD